MNQYNTFYIHKFFFDTTTNTAHFYYNFDNEVCFEETIVFSSSSFSFRPDIDMEILNMLLFHLHIALGVSYYKFFVSKNIVIQSGQIDDDQKEFWEKFYLNGLGEFLFRNQISPKNLFSLSSQSHTVYRKKDFHIDAKFLVPVGGGKDSIVSLELLKSLGVQIDAFTFAQNDNVLYQNTADNAGVKRLYIQRKLSENIKDVLNQGAYNGHVPITGMIAFVLQVVAYLYNYKYLVLSNEKSANFGNTFYDGLEVNHQWSKSLEFEEDFGKYLEQYISSEVKYFSLLRPYYEVKIAKMFAKFGKKYYLNFSSCNTNFKIFQKNTQASFAFSSQYWCNSCPKCVFVYIILRPYLSQGDVRSIFGRELYEDETLQDLFFELAGISGIKPFECVGTQEEVLFSMYKILGIWEGPYPKILEKIENEIKIKYSPEYFLKLEEQLMKSYFNESYIPENIIKKLQQYE